MADTTLRSNLTPSAVPTEIGNVLIDAVRKECVAALVAKSYPTSRRSLTLPVISSDLVAQNVAEGAAITLSDLGTTEVEIKPAKQVGATKWSNEAMADAFNNDGGALTILTGSLQAALASRIDQNMVDALAATASTDGGTTDLSDLDEFHAALAAIRNLGATPTSILVSPNTLLRLATIKEGTASRRSLMQPIAQDTAVLAVGGVPFVECRQVPDTVAYAVSADRLAFVSRNQATIELDRSVFALERKTLVLGEVRTATGVLQPAAVVKVTIAPAA